jgi:hypothetical protein
MLIGNNLERVKQCILLLRNEIQLSIEARMAVFPGLGAVIPTNARQILAVAVAGWHKCVLFVPLWLRFP